MGYIICVIKLNNWYSSYLLLNFKIGRVPFYYNPYSIYYTQLWAILKPIIRFILL